MTGEPASEDEDERDWVRDWHITFLLELGCSYDAAAPNADADPHEVAKLIRSGCPPDLAVEIVR